MTDDIRIERASAGSAAIGKQPSGMLERLLLAGLRISAPVKKADWAAAEAVIVRHGVLETKRAWPMVALSALTVLFELVGVFSLLPLMQLVQADQNVQALADQSRVWRAFLDFSASTGIPINITTLACLTMLLLSVRQVVFFLASRSIAGARERLAREIRLDLARRLFEAKPATIRKVGSGSFVVLMNQQAQYGAAIVSFFLQLAQIAMTFVAFAAGIAILSPWIIVAGTVCTGIIIVSLNRFARHSHKVNVTLAHEYDRLGQFLAQFYNAWRLVKLTNHFGPLMSQLERDSERIRSANMELVHQSGMTQLLAMPMAAVLGLGSLVVLTSLTSISVAQLTLIIVVLFRLGPMAEGMVRLRHSVSGTIAALRRIEELHARAVATRETDTGHAEFKPPARAITFRNVSFRYPGRDDPALSDVSLEVPARSLTAVIGPSGAGKSTLVDLLARIDEPDRGSILIDDVPTTAIRLSELRRGIFVVDQSAIMIDASVAENLRMANPDATDQQVREALALASADTFVNAMPAGLDSRVGENGAQLSGGQRQRLAIARALLSGAPVLVFDEPTSALDFEAEAAFRGAILAIASARRHTVILVAHRFSTIQDADYVVVLSDGRVEEAARPASLKHDGSYYRRMLQAQSAEAAL